MGSMSVPMCFSVKYREASHETGTGYQHGTPHQSRSCLTCNHQFAAPVQNPLPPLPPNCVQLAVMLKRNFGVTIAVCVRKKQLILAEF